MASVKILLYTHKTLKDGSHPIILQVIHNRKRKVLSSGYSAIPSQWNFDKNLPNSRHPNHTLLSSKLKSEKLKLEGIILEFDNLGKDFSVDEVISKYEGILSNDTLFNYVESILENFQKIGQIGNKTIYKNTKSVFSQFRNGVDVQLNEIDYRMIQDFERYLIENGRKVNTVSIHLRTLRAIINRAIKEGLIKEENYPFKRISIKQETTSKRAVNIEVIKTIESAELSSSDKLDLYRDLFLFSFYNRGMSFVDMVFLKNNNIENGRIIYKRRKTGQQFNIKITDKAKQIIDKYATLNNPDAYLFPVLQNNGNEYADYRNSMRLMNKKLKKISTKLGIEPKLTSYVSRHSWATIAKRSGIPIAVISEGLGHDSEGTTQIYLDSFENNVLDDANDQILNF